MALSGVFGVAVGYKRIASIYTNHFKCLQVLTQRGRLTELVVYAVDLIEGKHNCSCLLLECT